MKRSFTLLVFLGCLITAYSASAQTVPVTATIIADSAGNPYTGTVYFAPTLSNGQPTAYRKGGGGIITDAPIAVQVTAGVLSTALPDTTLTNPANICFKMTAPNIRAGYACLQPHATPTGSGDWCQPLGCNLNNFIPNLPNLGTIATGPQGPIGPQGPQGIAGAAGGGSIGDSDVVGQTASQSTVNLVGTVPATGKYRISYYANQNAVCTTGSVSALFTFVWMDASSPRTAKSIALTLSTTQSSNAGSIQGIIPVYAVSSSAITYTSTVTGSCATGGPSSYDAHISVEEVQ